MHRFRGWNVSFLIPRKGQHLFSQRRQRTFVSFALCFRVPWPPAGSFSKVDITICIFHKYSKHYAGEKVTSCWTLIPLWAVSLASLLALYNVQCWYTMMLVGKKKEEEWVAKNEDHVEGSYDLDRMMMMLIGECQERWWGSETLPASLQSGLFQRPANYLSQRD